MSLILDALNKADKERDPEATPSLNSDHDRPLSFYEVSDDKKPFYIAGAVSGLVFLLLLIWLVSGDDEKQAPAEAPSTSNTPISNTESLNQQASEPRALARTPSSAATTSNTNQSTANATASTIETPRPKVSTAPAVQKSVNTNKAVAQQYERAAQEQQATKEKTQESKAASKPVATQAENDSRVAAIYQLIDEPENPTPTPVPTPTPAQNFPSLADYGTLSFIGDLPYSKQKGIPTLMYTDHNYQRNSATVTINKVARRKGDRIADGLVLEDIVQDGIVLNFKSTLRFKVVAYNSWVNM